MISFKCDKTVQRFLIGGVVVDVRKMPDGSVQLKVHLEPGSTDFKRLKRPKKPVAKH